MKKRETNFYILVFIVFFLFSAIITIKDGYLYQILFKINNKTPGFEKHTLKQINEIKNYMLKGAFKPQLVFETIKDLSMLPILLTTVIVAMVQINLKNRYYVYLVGRGKKFFRKYILDTLRKITISTVAIHLSISLWIFICFLINGNLDPDEIILYDSYVQNIKFIHDIHRESPAMFIFVMAWIPVYLFTILNCLIIVIFNEIFRSKPISIGIFIGYIFLTSQILSGLGYYHLGPIIPTGITILVEFPYQYVFVSLIFPIFILITATMYRRIMKIDEL